MEKFNEKLDNALGSQATYKIAAFLILLGILMGSFNTNQSYAWFTDASENPFSLTSGKVNYEISYTTEPGLMVPGKDLIAQCKVKNLSSIDTHFRLKLEYTLWELDGNTPASAVSSTAIYITNASITPGTVTENQYLNVEWPEGKFDSANVGTDVDKEIFWQYNTTVSAVPAGDIENNTGVEIPVFNKLYYDGPKTQNVFSGNPVTVKITLQAKQADHVNWAEITLFEKFEGTR